MPVTTRILGRENALEFTTDRGRRYVDRYAVSRSAGVGLDVAYVELEERPSERLELPVTRRVAKDWILDRLPDFTADQALEALALLTKTGPVGAGA